MFEQKVEDLIIKNTILDYVNRLQSSFVLYKKIKTNDIKSKALDKLFMIGRVNPFIPLIMNVFEKENEKKRELFFESIWKFTFRSTLIGLRNDNESFYGYIRRKENFLNLFEQIVVENWWNINARVEVSLNSVNHYEWINKNIIKYILFSYENKIRSKKGYPLLTTEDYFSEDSRMKLNIEHITAQRAKNIKLSEKFKEEYLHNIGNLVIDTTASNSRKGNKGGEEKKEEFSSSSLMSQSEITDFDVNWNSIKSIQEFIDRRGKQIKEFVIKELM
ncbi:MAG: GmrSD restriction endonuclease domain-containing protein [Cetobacterium sp.]